MTGLRHMLRNASLLNLLLAGVLGYLLAAVVLPYFTGAAVYSGPQVKRPAGPPEAVKKAGPEETKVPSPADYLVIGDQNLFHPERKIPVPLPPKVEAPPLPKPEFILYGTLETSEQAVAFMEDRKAPRTTQGRGKRQIPLKLGDSLSGFVLKKIETDKVIMTRGEETITVNLNDRVKDRDIPGSAPAGAQKQQPRPPQAAGQQLMPQPPQAVQPPQQPAEAPANGLPAVRRPMRRGFPGAR